MPQHRIYVFTSFQPLDEENLRARHAVVEFDCLSYQEEIAPGTGRRHWQGYIELHRRGGARDVQRIIGNKCHVERCVDPEAAYEYSQKEETRAPGCEPVVIGEFGGGERQGKRTDIADAAHTALLHGAAAVAQSDPATFVRYHRGLEAIHRTTIRPRRSADDAPCVRVYIGPTGVGKTRSVYDEFGDSEVFSKDDSKWWDGYHGQTCVLFDEWVGSSEIPPVQLLKICDRYPLPVQTKGGYVPMSRNTTHIVFTTNIEVVRWYTEKAGQWAELLPSFQRRVAEIKRRWDEPVTEHRVEIDLSQDDEEEQKYDIVDADN